MFTSPANVCGQIIRTQAKNDVKLTLRQAHEDDLDLLAAMNERLVVDQGSRPWPLAEFRKRFEGWLQTREWSVDVFSLGEKTVGYIAYQVQPDHYDPEENVIFVRHFYVERDSRRKGVGSTAFAALRESIPDGIPISLEVVSTNPDGQRFWMDMGFSPVFTSLKLPPDR